MFTLFFLFALAQPLMLDMGEGKTGSDWYIINDGVMGGRSSSSFDLKKDHLHFAGTISLENNGGFASLRSPWNKYNLKGKKSVTIKARGTGGQFSLILEKNREWWLPTYKYTFEPTSEWQEFTVDLKDLVEYTVQGKTGKKLGKDGIEDIIRIGIIKYDGKAGPFELEIDELIFQ